MIWENKFSVREPPFELYSTAKQFVSKTANEEVKNLDLEELEFERREVLHQVITVPNTHEYHPVQRSVF